MSELLIDGTDAKAAVGFRLLDAPGDFDSPETTYEEATIPGRRGMVRMSNEPIVSARDGLITGYIVADDEDDLTDKLDALRVLCRQGRHDVTLTIVNRASLERVGRLVRIACSPTPPAFIASKVPVELHFRYADPVASETTPTTVSGAEDEAVECPLGTEESHPVITLTGATDPVVTYKNAAGDTIGSMTIDTGGVSVDVVIDCAELTIAVDGDDAPESLTAGDFFTLDPDDADGEDGPTIETDSGALSATYTKNYR